jgi:hypothetical protein
MSIIAKLPSSYTFSEADVDKGWDIFKRYMEDKTVTDAEMELSDYAVKAGDMRRTLKRWPTVAEVTAEFEKEADEAEKRYVNTFTEEAQKKYWAKKEAERAKQQQT